MECPRCGVIDEFGISGKSDDYNDGDVICKACGEAVGAFVQYDTIYD